MKFQEVIEIIDDQYTSKIFAWKPIIINLNYLFIEHITVFVFIGNRYLYILHLIICYKKLAWSNVTENIEIYNTNRFY